MKPPYPGTKTHRTYIYIYIPISPRNACPWPFGPPFTCYTSQKPVFGFHSAGVPWVAVGRFGGLVGVLWLGRGFSWGLVGGLAGLVGGGVGGGGLALTHLLRCASTASTLPKMSWRSPPPPPLLFAPLLLLLPPPSLSGRGRPLSLGGGDPRRRRTKRKRRGVRTRHPSPTQTSSSSSRWLLCHPCLSWGGGGGLGLEGRGVGGGGGPCPLPFLFHLLYLPTSHLLPNPPIVTSQPPHLRHVCPLTGLVGPRWAPQHAAMLPLLQAAEHGQPKRRILGEELVQAPKPNALLPILVAPHDPWYTLEYPVSF